MEILFSTRGTTGSDIWFMRLAERPMARRYHLMDYDWTPLSQNPVQTCDDIILVLPCCAARILRRASVRSGGLATAMRLSASVPSPIRLALACRSDSRSLQRGSAKSFADDLALGRGAVPSRAVSYAAKYWGLALARGDLSAWRTSGFVFFYHFFTSAKLVEEHRTVNKIINYYVCWVNGGL